MTRRRCQATNLPMFGGARCARKATYRIWVAPHSSLFQFQAEVCDSHLAELTKSAQSTCEVIIPATGQAAQKEQP